MDKVKIVKTLNISEPWSVIMPNGVEYDTHELYSEALSCAENCYRYWNDIDKD